MFAGRGAGGGRVVEVNGFDGGDDFYLPMRGNDNGCGEGGMNIFNGAEVDRASGGSGGGRLVGRRESGFLMGDGGWRGSVGER